eukprot:TRINITY_DN4732_c0_g1_i1.p1 TRINITY_DN4732_c0_g1~~TRINITY_DN4732_c0_g1_i1.p1  ORF type:complete len:184 (+),score=54.73 TRINITY_DN4732_c0_g1_i1:105-656(+)
MGCASSKSKIMEKRVMMVGLDAAGKTTVLYRLHRGERVDTEPTLGFNVEVIDHAGARLTIWDLGGQEKIRPCWRKYFLLADGIIFVVDSADSERFEEAHRELTKVLQANELKGAPLLLLANKQDATNAVSDAGQIKTAMGLENPDRPLLVQLANATAGTGLWEGLGWLVEELKKLPPKKSASS